VLDTSTQILNAIVAAAANPRVDVAKMTQLVQLQADMEARAAKIGYDNALAQLQAELPEIDRKGSIVIRRKDPKTGDRTGPIEQKTPFAKWEDIMDVLRPLLRKHNFSLSFRVGQAPDGRIMVTAILARAGHREDTTMILQHDSTGSKNPVQAVGSTTSYGKRYTAGMLLNIVTRGEDDDASRVRGSMLIDKDQVLAINKLIHESGADTARFLALFKAETVPQIPADRFDEAVEQLTRKLEQKGKPAKSDFPGDTPLPKNEFK
jgi:hypothetical protein